MTQNGFAEINGTKFYYEVSGQGFPLVLVHAGIADCRMWDGQFDTFARQYQAVRYDRRGFGKTAMVAGDYSQYHDLYAFLKFLGIEQAILVGCSQGAKTVTDFTLEYPKMTKALVLVAPALGGFIFNGEPPKQEEQLELAEQTGDLDLVNELELQIWVDGPQRTAEQVNPNVRELAREMNRIALQTPEDLGNEIPLVPAAVNRLSEINVPALVITGDLDTPRTLAGADFLAQNIPGAKKATMNGVAHLPNMELPEEFNQLVLSFLEQT
ncbi:alpha/beta hydrolase [Candidatus Villigracilis affinis]|uniref:alpha/beta fold hydrolase n=1 Tax=Candidatus Villigracilis affinis TaxID=3140682 RepID=UPI002A1ECC20|nr:alpha/beta hydrolase [Anaerolineales bacterium]